MPNSRNVVLITRPEPGASDTAARVEELGLTPIVAPVLRIERTPARLPAAASLAAVLVTSGNAVDALPEAYRGTRVLSVGDATAERARTRMEVVGHEGSSKRNSLVFPSSYSFSLCFQQIFTGLCDRLLVLDYRKNRCWFQFLLTLQKQ